MQLFCHVPNAQTCWRHFFSPVHCAMFQEIRIGADAYTRVTVLVHLKAVFIFPAAAHASSVLYGGPESNFLRFSPSFLSEKSEVICKPRPFQPTQVHAAVSSEDYGPETHTHAHMFWDFRKATESVKKLLEEQLNFL